MGLICFCLSIFADRKCQEDRKMLYGNMVEIFLLDGDAIILSIRKEDVVQLDFNNIWMMSGRW
jgi:hypothetical protein